MKPFEGLFAKILGLATAWFGGLGNFGCVLLEGFYWGFGNFAGVSWVWGGSGSAHRLRVGLRSSVSFVCGVVGSGCLGSFTIRLPV